MDLSLELRGARERAGLSREEVSSRLTVQLRYIEALERNYHELPAGAERDALLRAYARVIGLDPEEVIARARAGESGTAELWLSGDVVDEFPKESDLRSPAPTAPPRGDIRPEAPTSRERPTAYPTAPAPAQHADITVATPRAVERARPPEAHVAAALADLPLKAATHVERDQRGVPAAREPGESAGAVVSDPVLRRPERDVFSPAVTYRRGGIGVAAGALMAIVLAIFAGAYVYERTRAASGDGQDARVSASDAPATEVGAHPAPEGAPADRGDAAMTGDLLTAGATTGKRQEATATPEPPPVVPPVSEEALPPPTARAAPPSTSGAEPPLMARQEPAADAPAVPEEKPRETALAAPAEDLSGVWTFVTRVESSIITSFEDLELGYRIQLSQNGNAIEGTGQKVSENGRTLAAPAQTPIVLDGTIAGERLTMTFTEHGTRRSSAGRFVLVREDGAAWRGRFSSDAARSSGTVLARRAE